MKPCRLQFEHSGWIYCEEDGQDCELYEFTDCDRRVIVNQVPENRLTIGGIRNE